MGHSVAQLIDRLPPTSPFVIFVLDMKDGSAPFSSRPMMGMLGYPVPPEARKWKLPPVDLLHPDDVDRYRELISRQLQVQDDQLVESEIRFRRADGSYATIATTGVVLSRADDGTVREVLGVARDVTEERRAQREREDARANLSAVLEATSDPICAIDVDGRLLTGNAAFHDGFQALTGHGIATGARIRPLMRAEHLTAWDAATARVLAGERFTERVSLTVREMPLYIEMRFHPIERDGVVIGAALFGRNVTRRVLAERELAASEERFRLVAERAHDVISLYRIKPTPGTVFISPSIEKILGYAPEEFYANPELHFSLIHPDDVPRLQELHQNWASGEPTTLRWKHRDGHSVWLELRMVPELDEAGELVAMQSISRDVTERVQLEASLRQSQKMEAVGRLAGGVAHDFNNLLGVALGHLELVRRRPERTVESLKAIEDALQRGAALTRQILSFARPDHARTRAVRVDRLLGTLREMLRRLVPESIDLDVSCEPELVVRADPVQLEQVIVNLALNARDAMPDGGLLSIAARAQGDRVLMEVRDSGHGMDEATRSRVFEPFFTTKPKGSGTGLGLAIVYGIVKEAGGDITIESAPGAGAAFFVTLPALALADMPESRPPAAAEALYGAELLLVEDEPALLSLLQTMLSEAGFRVIGQSDPLAALEAMQLRRKAPDLLVTDVVMPRLSGPQLADELRRRWPELPVVYMSGYTADEIARHGAEDGVVLLYKPFDQAQLMRTVARMLPARRAAPA